MISRPDQKRFTFSQSSTECLSQEDSDQETMRLGAHEIAIDEGTMAYSLYRNKSVWERHRHRLEVKPKYIQEITSKGLKFSGKSDLNRRMEILEVPSNRFHFATQFHAEFK